LTPKKSQLFSGKDNIKKDIALPNFKGKKPF
jgi:hypothetical protein